MLGESKFRQYAKTKHWSKLLVRLPDIETFSGHRIKPLGKTHIKLDKVRKACSVIVVEDWEVNKDMVLATDALNEGNAIINFQRKDLIWYGGGG